MLVTNVTYMYQHLPASFPASAACLRLLFSSFSSSSPASSSCLSHTHLHGFCWWCRGMVQSELPDGAIFNFRLLHPRRWKNKIGRERPVGGVEMDTSASKFRKPQPPGSVPGHPSADASLQPLYALFFRCKPRVFVGRWNVKWDPFSRVKGQIRAQKG